MGRVAPTAWWFRGERVAGFIFLRVRAHRLLLAAALLSVLACRSRQRNRARTAAYRGPPRASLSRLSAPQGLPQRPLEWSGDGDAPEGPCIGTFRLVQ